MTKDLNGNRSLRHGGRSSATPGGLGAFESAPPDSGQQKETKVPKRIVLRLKNVTFVLFVAFCKNPWMSGARTFRSHAAPKSKELVSCLASSRFTNRELVVLQLLLATESAEDTASGEVWVLELALQWASVKP
jgi:hypothetical protein